jgi:hypothetical protein
VVYYSLCFDGRAVYKHDGLCGFLALRFLSGLLLTLIALVCTHIRSAFLIPSHCLFSLSLRHELA